jgi:2'-5' RNA ligase
MRGINPHITLKYYIAKKHLAALEKICTEVTCTHRKAKFSVGSLGDFGKHVLFLNVKPSAAFKKIYDDLFKRCKQEHIPLDPNERAGIHLHVTLAQGIAASDFKKIREYATKQQLKFDLELERVTILKFANDTFSTHKTFTFVNK